MAETNPAGHDASGEKKTPRRAWHRKKGIWISAALLALAALPAAKYWWYPDWQVRAARNQALKAQSQWLSIHKDDSIFGSEIAVQAGSSLEQGELLLGKWQFNDATADFQTAKLIYEKATAIYVASTQEYQTMLARKTAALNAQHAWQSLQAKSPLFPTDMDQWDDAIDSGKRLFAAKKYSEALDKFSKSENAFADALKIYHVTMQRFEPEEETKYQGLNDQEKAAVDKETCDVFAQRLHDIYTKYNQSDSAKLAAAKAAAALAGTAMSSGNNRDASAGFARVREIYRSTIRSVPEQYKTIQSAIDAADAGDIVFFGAGTYAGPIKLKDGVWLYGTDRDSVFVNGDPEASVLTAKGCGSGVIAGITFEHNGTKGDGDINMPCVWLSAGNLVVADCRVRKSNGPGLFCDQGDRSTLRNNLCELNRYAGISSVGVGTRITVESNEGSHNGSHGMLVREGGEAVIKGNTFSENKECGIYVFGEATRADIDADICSQNGQCGVSVADQANVDVENCTCNSDYDGIAYSTGAQGTASKNQCSDNTHAGICSVGSGTLITIRNNHCYSNHESGVNFRGGGGLAEDNDCTNNAAWGVLFCCETVDGIAKHNICSSNGSDGIHFRQSSRGKAEGNICQSNRQYGIGVEDGSFAILDSNTCTENKGSGVRFESGTSGDVSGNQCNKNGQNGISADGADRLTLTGNTCSNNHDFGINYVNCTPTLKDNKLTENRGGEISAPPAADPVQ